MLQLLQESCSWSMVIDVSAQERDCVKHIAPGFSGISFSVQKFFKILLESATHEAQF
jgi:hypothetical protein